MNWQPINTAPKDGTPVMTDDGFCLYQVVRGKPVWYACGTGGYPYRCIDEGPWECSPKYWISLPPIPS